MYILTNFSNITNNTINEKSHSISLWVITISLSPLICICGVFFIKYICDSYFLIKKKLINFINKYKKNEELQFKDGKFQEKYIIKNNKNNLSTDETCTICLDEFIDKKNSKTITLDCKHKFCTDCLESWTSQQLNNLKYDISCPLCRNEFISISMKTYNFNNRYSSNSLDSLDTFYGLNNIS